MATGRTIIVESKQTIYDIAKQYYGSADAIFLLFKDNPELVGLNTVLYAGQLLRITSPAIDADVVEFYAKNNITSATEVDDINEYELPNVGDFDENDFDENDFLTL